MNSNKIDYIFQGDDMAHEKISDRIENVHSLLCTLGLEPEVTHENLQKCELPWREVKNLLIEATGGEISPLQSWDQPSVSSIVDHYLLGNDVDHPIDKTLKDAKDVYSHGGQRLGFVIPITPRAGIGKIIPPSVPPGFMEGVTKAGDWITRMNEFAVSVQMGQENLQRKSATAQKIAEDIAQNIKSKPDVRFPGQNGSGTDVYSDNYASGSPVNPRGLSLSVQPIESRLVSNIGVTNFPYYYKNAKYNTSPVIFKAFNMFVRPNNAAFNGVADPTLDDFLQGTLMTDVRTQVLKENIYNNEAQTLLRYDFFSQWWNTLAFALCIYFWFNSIIAFQAIPSTRNSGMEAIYNSIDPQDLVNLQNLGFELSKQSIPPTLVETCHYLMDNFVQSEMPGSPIVKLMPMAFERPSGPGQPFTKIFEYGTSNGPVSVARKLLKMDNFLRFNALMGKTYSTWTEPTLGGYTGAPKHDPNFTTMWVNYGYYHTGVQSNLAARKFSPAISAIGERIQYNYHTDAPDGWTQALFPVKVGTAIRNSISGQLYVDYTGASPAFVSINSGYDLSTTTTGCSTSCIIYAEYHGAPGFYPIELLSRFQALSGNTYVGTTINNVTNSYQKFGATAADNTSIIGINYTTEQFLSWLILNDFNKVSGRSGGSSGRGRGRRRRNQKDEKDEK